MQTIKNLLYLAVILLFVSGAVHAQEDSLVYKTAINSVGVITDKNGLIASGFFINSNTFVTNNHVTQHIDTKSAEIRMKDGRIFKKGEKLRKRYRCEEVGTKKVYLFSPVFEVELVA